MVHGPLTQRRQTSDRGSQPLELAVEDGVGRSSGSDNGSEIEDAVHRAGNTWRQNLDIHKLRRKEG